MILPKKVFMKAFTFCCLLMIKKNEWYTLHSLWPRQNIQNSFPFSFICSSFLFFCGFKEKKKSDHITEGGNEGMKDGCICAKFQTSVD